MKKLLLFLLITGSMQSYAAKSDSTFQRHIIVVAETDGMSHLFADGPSGATVHTVTGSGPFSRSTDTKYLPNYVLHIHLLYSLGVTRHIRLETGLGYMFEGLTVRTTYSNPGFIPSSGSYKGYIFARKFTVPLYVKLLKPIKSGALTLTVGPEFTLPVNSFTKGHDNYFNGVKQDNFTTHMRYTPAATFYETSMGINLKMGYEKYFHRHVSIDMEPVVNFSDLVLLDKNLMRSYRASGYRPYHYYIGFDVAINFGLKKK